MPASRRAPLASIFAVITLALAARAQAPTTPELGEFKPKGGGFRVLLPGKPAYEKVEVGETKQLQHQFAVGGPSGAYLVSYQDNPNLEGATSSKIAEALALGRDSLVKGFSGNLAESKSIELAEKYPGLAFRVTIPAAGGEARCRFYMVGTRLYQVMAIGLPAFAGSDEATKVLDSFALVEE